MKIFFFLLIVFSGKLVRDNLPNLNYKSLWQALLNSDPFTMTVRSTQVLISMLIFVVVDIGEDFGLAALAEPSIVEFSAKILTCLAFTEVVYRIFQLVIEQIAKPQS